MSTNAVGPAPQKDFAKVPAPQVPRSVFHRPKNHKTTMNSGDLVPVYWVSTLPGDTLHLHAALFGRLATQKYPMMDSIYVDLLWFHVSERILWKQEGPSTGSWERFQGFQPTPTSTTDFITPRMYGTDSSAFEVKIGELGDYLGLPIGVIDSSDFHVRASPFRAYRAICNAWIRDENYQAEWPVSYGDGPDDYNVYKTLIKRGKRHDYFTSALPSPQKGPSVPIPWAGDGLAPIYGVEDTPVTFLGLDTNQTAQGMFLGGANYLGLNSAPAASRVGMPPDDSYPPSGLVANVASISASLNEFRESMVMQQIYELDARGGTRYVEAVWNRFRTVLPDATAQRPEYIGGTSTKLNAVNVAQTSPGDGASVLAALATYSQAGLTHRVTYSCQEHGIIMCLANIRAPITYQQRLDREWGRQTRFDFYEPLTAHLGEQAVMQSEIYFPPFTPETVWGYQERWAEYRYDTSMVTGKFRSVAVDSLDAYHLALDFETPPEFDSNFIQDDPPIDRVVALPNEPQFLVDFLVSNRHARVMPVYGVPGLTRF